MKTYTVYFLLLKNGKIYTGITNNLDRRVSEHLNDTNPKSYTSRFKVDKLLGYIDFTNPTEAIEAEKKFKGWSKLKKLAFINQDWDLIKQLSTKKYTK
jgi:putative endonuclease